MLFHTQLLFSRLTRKFARLSGAAALVEDLFQGFLVDKTACIVEAFEFFTKKYKTKGLISYEFLSPLRKV